MDNFLENNEELDLSLDFKENIEPGEFQKFQKLRILNLYGNYLTYLQNGIFDELENLEKLDLSNNKIETIKSNVFKQLKKLRILNLNRNNLTLIQNGIFDGLQNLEKLDLSRNKIKTIDADAFEQLKKLTSLYLNYNKLTSLPKRLFNELKNLEEFYLYENEIETIEPDVFKKLKKLRILDFNLNNLTPLPKKLFDELQNLEELVLNCKKIEKNKMNLFKKLKKLRILNFYGNNLTYLQNGIFDELENLEKLDLSNNKIETIKSYVFKKLKKLKTINLRSNNLTFLQNGIFDGLKNLEKLDLSRNKIKTIQPNVFKQFKILMILNLYGNNLTCLQNGIFDGLENLEEFYLHENEIETIEPDVFKQLKKLKILILYFNKLKLLSKRIFDGLQNLEKLDLSRNKIKTIERGVFIQLTKLTSLNLNFNNLTLIENGKFDGLENLEEFYLHENEIETIEPDVFKQFKKLKNLDLSYNNLFELEIFFYSFMNELSLFYNKLSKCRLHFVLESKFKLKIDLSSNFLSSLYIFNLDNKNDILYNRKNICSILVPNYLIEINLRFNKFTEYSSLNFDSSIKILENNFEFDFRNNDFDLKSIEKLQSFNFVKIQDDQNILNNIGYFSYTDFQNECHCKEFNHLTGFKNSINIPMFTVITGKNGFGKSTLLNFIENQLFNSLDNNYKDENDLLINDKNKVCIFDFDKLIIPVCLKFHGSIESNSDLLNKIQKIKVFSFDKKNSQYDNIDKFNILSVYNLDMALDFFSNRFNYLNDHLKLNDYKYSVHKKNDIIILRAQNLEIELEQQSPGEKFILLLYIWEFFLSRLPFRHRFILLLDEPDAHLHPKSVHEFISILKKVCLAGAQVMMTTHNPTTVSFIPKENLFVIRETKENGFKYSIENDDVPNIINELTDGLVVVSQPIKFVYVEGDGDKAYYERVKDLIAKSGRTNFKSQIIFQTFNINNERGCNAIRSLICKFLESKIFHHMGIVDNDNNHLILTNNNKDDDYFKSILDQPSNDTQRPKRILNIQRHSLENYILDPIYFYFYFKRQNPPNSDQTQLDEYFDGIQSINDLDYNRHRDQIHAFLAKFAQKLWAYLTSYESNKFSSRIFTKIDDKDSIVYKLVDIFYFLNVRDKKCKDSEMITFNSVEFFHDLLNTFPQNLGNRYTNDIKFAKTADVNVYDLDSKLISKNKFSIHKDFERVTCFIHNLPLSTIAELIILNENLVKYGIISETVKIGSLENNHVKKFTQYMSSNAKIDKSRERELINDYLEITKLESITLDKNFKPKSAEHLISSKCLQKDLNALSTYLKDKIITEYKIVSEFLPKNDSKELKDNFQIIQSCIKEKRINQVDQVNDCRKKLERILLKEKIKNLIELFVRELGLVGNFLISQKILLINSNEPEKSSLEQDLNDLYEFVQLKKLDDCQEIKNKYEKLQLTIQARFNKKENLKDYELYNLYIQELVSQKKIKKIKKLNDVDFDLNNETIKNAYDDLKEVDFVIENDDDYNKKLNSYNIIRDFLFSQIELFNNAKSDRYLDVTELLRKKLLNEKFNKCRDLKSMIEMDKNQLKNDLTQLSYNTDYQSRLNDFKTIRIYKEFIEREKIECLKPLDDMFNQLKEKDLLNDNFEINSTYLTSASELESLKNLTLLKISNDNFEQFTNDYNYVKKKLNISNQPSNLNDKIFGKLLECLKGKNFIFECHFKCNKSELNKVINNNGDKLQKSIENIIQHNFYDQDWGDVRNQLQLDGNTLEELVNELKNKNYISKLDKSSYKPDMNEMAKSNNFIKDDLNKLKTSIENLIKNSEKFDQYLELKNKLDQELIDYMKEKLINEKVECNFADSDEECNIEYPMIFYRLRGHTYEYLLHEMFFPNTTYQQGSLSKQVFEHNPLKSAHFVPLEMKKILQTIDDIQL